MDREPAAPPAAGPTVGPAPLEGGETRDPLTADRGGALAVRLSYRSILLVLGAVALGLAARNVVGRSLGVLTWTLRCSVIAALVYPLITLLGRRLPRGLAVLVTLLAFGAVITGIGYTVVGDVRAEQSRLSRVLPEAAHRLETSDRFGTVATDFQLSDRVSDLLEALPRQIAGGTGTAAVRRTATRGATVLVNIVLSIFLVLYGSRLVNGAIGQVTDDRRRERVRAVVDRAYHRAWVYVVGRLGIGLLAGISAYVLCRVADVPGPTVLALVVVLGSIVPYIGVIVGGLPIVLLGFGLHPAGYTGTVLLVSLLAIQVVEAIVLMRPLHRRSIVFGPALSVLVSMVCFALGGLGLALSGWAVAVFLACIADEIAPAAPPGAIAAASA